MDFPVLPQEIQDINEKLKRHFGVDTESGNPIWRVSWSSDQYEKRLTEYTKDGFLLLQPEVRELPKYNYCKNRWILENYVFIPDLTVDIEKAYAFDMRAKSYENMYTFEDGRTGDAIRPVFEACKFIIDLLAAQKGKTSLRKYIDTSENPEEKEKRINKLQEELFGEESSLLGRTITGEAVAYTGEPKIEPASQKE